MGDPTAADAQPGFDVDWSGLEVLGYAECRLLLGQERVGRIGLVDAGSPVILPVNFALDGSSIVFRSAHGAKLESAVMGRPVCIEVDSWNVLTHTGWSVLAKGVAEHVIDGDEIRRLDRFPVRPWAHPEVRHEWIRVHIDELSGRRINLG